MRPEHQSTAEESTPKPAVLRQLAVATMQLTDREYSAMGALLARKATGGGDSRWRQSWQGRKEPDGACGSRTERGGRGFQGSARSHGAFVLRPGPTGSPQVRVHGGVPRKKPTDKMAQSGKSAPHSLPNRLADRGLLETSWEPGVGSRPPRHLHRLTGVDRAR